MLPIFAFAKTRRVFVTFPLGIAVVMLFMRSPSWFWQPSTLQGIWLFEALLFALIGLLGCAIAPTVPFSSAVAGVLGAFAGGVADVIIHPTIEGGFERNLFPLEIAFHTVAAIVGFGAVALVWNVGARLIRKKIDA